MKAVAAVRPGEIDVVELPMPRIEAYECLVKVRSCGFCATDIKIIDNAISNLTVNYPAVLGHEGIGEVIEVGPKVRNIRVGDVFMNPNGRVDPATGLNRMWANMVEYAVVQDHAVMKEMGLPKAAFAHSGAKIPSDIRPADGGMLLALTEAYSGVINFGVGPGTELLVYGDGPIALALIVFARLRGAAWVGCAGHHDDRLERIRRLGGADLVLNSHDRNIEAELAGRPLDLVIDAVGSTALIKQGSKLLKTGGTVGVYGVLKQKDSTLSLIDLKNHTSIHMLNWPHGAGDVLDELLTLIRQGHVRPSDFYTHVVPIAEAQRALQLIRSREAFRVILTM